MGRLNNFIYYIVVAAQLQYQYIAVSCQSGVTVSVASLYMNISVVLLPAFQLLFIVHLNLGISGRNQFKIEGNFDNINLSDDLNINMRD